MSAKALLQLDGKIAVITGGPRCCGLQIAQATAHPETLEYDGLTVVDDLPLSDQILSIF